MTVHLGARASSADDAGFVHRSLVVVLFASIFLQRFGLSLGNGVSINLIITTGVLAVLAVRGVFAINRGRAIALSLLATSVAVSSALNATSTSAPSAVLVLLVYVPYALSLRVAGFQIRSVIQTFQAMMFICALAGIVQFVGQFAVGAEGLFSFEGFLPSSILLPGYNTVNPLAWGVDIQKSNGFFFLEPSIFSQYLALAIVFELLYFGRPVRFVAYGIALLLSYSGTGLILVLLLVPCILVYRRAYKAISGLLIFAVIAVAAGDLWNMDALLTRMGEFGQRDTSATARFIAGSWLISEYLLGAPSDVMFGLGPGSFLQHAHLVSYEAHDAAWAKVLFEYGLVGSAAFWPLFGISLFSAKDRIWISIALTIGFFTFGGTVLDPRLQALILVFCVLPPPDETIATSAARCTRSCGAAPPLTEA